MALKMPYLKQKHRDWETNEIDSLFQKKRKQEPWGMYEVPCIGTEQRERTSINYSCGVKSRNELQTENSGLERWVRGKLRWKR